MFHRRPWNGVNPLPTSSMNLLWVDRSKYISVSPDPIDNKQLAFRILYICPCCLHQEMLLNAPVIHSTRVMPTNTQPFEILFEFMNDMSEPTTLERMQSGQNGTASIGLTVWLQERESISLVLDAGSTYHYLIKRLGCNIEAVISCVSICHSIGVC